MKVDANKNYMSMSMCAHKCRCGCSTNATNRNTISAITLLSHNKISCKRGSIYANKKTQMRSQLKK